MKKVLLVTIVLVLSVASTCFAVKRVLFIGNSYTGVNDLPNTFYNLCLSLGDTVVVDVNSPGGYTFNNHTTNATTISKIQQGNWDYVVLQEQSQIPAFSPAQVASDCYPYAKKLCDTIRHFNPCAEVLFYMTWGRKNGDAGNCANYPPICTYAGMQQRLRESYLEMADSNNVSCSPVGAVWNVFRANFPATELYNPDESHPSANGTYLAACTFYSSIFHKSSLGATYLLGGVTAFDAANIQTTATSVVMDSLETWQQQGSIPFSKFSYSVTGNNVGFTNQSLRYTTSNWDFGDGSPASSLTNPTHSYSNNGNFTVTLTVYKDSCKQESSQQVVTVSGTPTGIDEHVDIKPNVSYHNQLLTIQQAEMGSTIELYNLNGQSLFKQVITHLETTIPLSLSNGVYLFKLSNDRQQTLFKGKILVK